MQKSKEIMEWNRAAGGADAGVKSKAPKNVGPNTIGNKAGDCDYENSCEKNPIIHYGNLPDFC